MMEDKSSIGFSQEEWNDEFLKKEEQLSKSQNLTDSDIAYFSDHLRQDQELFTNAEERFKIDLKEAQAKEREIENELKSLGSKPWAGKKPDPQEYIVKPVKTGCYIWLGCILALFVFHCLFWLIKVIFNIPWDTWGWTKTCFWWGMIIIGIIFIVSLIAFSIKYYLWNRVHKKAIAWQEWKDYFENHKSEAQNKIRYASKNLDNLYKNRAKILLFTIRKKFNLPLKEITTHTYSSLRNDYFSLLKLQNNILKLNDPLEKLEASISFANKKLDIFFLWSIPSEASSSSLMNDFLNYYSRKKHNYREDVVIPCLQETSIRAVNRENNGFEMNLLDADIEAFNDILDWDISGMFGKPSSSRLEEQVNALENVYKDAISIYKSYTKVNTKINQILGLSRLVAYKNLYLGVELLNIIRDNAGGGNLTTVGDKVESVTFDKNTTWQIQEFSSSKAFQDILNTGFESILVAIGNGVQDKRTRKFMSQNPKTTAMALAGMAVLAAGEELVKAWKQRNAKIESLLSKQKHIIKEMKLLPESFQKNLAASSRAIEIAEAIIKTNNGFMAIYQPIYNKVFIKKEINSVTMFDCQQLALAIKEYKTISDSRL